MNFKELGAALGLEEEEYRELIELFLASGTGQFKALSAALAAGDADGAMRSAHTIKGASGNLGLHELSRIAGIIENRARNRQLDDLTQYMDNLQVQFDAIQAHIPK